MSWNWFGDDEVKHLPFQATFVGEQFAGPIDVIYKVEVTYSTREEELTEVVENPTKILTLKLENLGKDIFKNQSQLKSFAHQFSLGLDSIANHLPHTDKIHLFPTVPVGLAFLMGTKINPLITKPIITYQFDANKTPKHQQILILQETEQREENISADDQRFIDDIKNELKAELENKIASFASSK